MTDVTETDRAAREEWRTNGYNCEGAWLLLDQAFARHREASIAPYVEALRTERERAKDVVAIGSRLDHVNFDPNFSRDVTRMVEEARSAISQIDALLTDTKGEG